VVQRGVCESALKLHAWQEGDRRFSQGQNRIREIRPSGIVGGLTKTWAMVRANRARKAETPTQTSSDLRLRASYFYPDRTGVGEVPWTTEARSSPRNPLDVEKVGGR
jgi:hypothetical protein